MNGMQTVKEINSIKHKVAKIFILFDQLVENPLSCSTIKVGPKKRIVLLEINLCYEDH
jgi:hypothetical protein